MFEVAGGTPATARRKNYRSSRADRFEVVYLRAAQAYMLISMPTGTSTILGVFQVIASSEVFGANSTPGLNLEARPISRKCGRLKNQRLRPVPDGRYFPPGQSCFSLEQGAHDKGDVDRQIRTNSNSFLSTPTRKCEPAQQRRAKRPDRNDRDRCELAIVRALHNFAGSSSIFGHCLFRD
jgi:hypothetical protein